MRGKGWESGAGCRDHSTFRQLRASGVSATRVPASQVAELGPSVMATQAIRIRGSAGLAPSRAPPLTDEQSYYEPLCIGQ
jgi:hypothetical protein